MGFGGVVVLVGLDAIGSRCLCVRYGDSPFRGGTGVRLACCRVPRRRWIVVGNSGRRGRRNRDRLRVRREGEVKYEDREVCGVGRCVMWERCLFDLLLALCSRFWGEVFFPSLSRGEGFGRRLFVHF